MGNFIDKLKKIYMEEKDNPKAPEYVKKIEILLKLENII